MKIAIYPNYGSIYVPPFISKQLSKEKDWTHNRIEIANIIEKLKPTHNKITQKIYTLYATSEPNEVNCLNYIKDTKNPNIIYVKELEKIYGQIYKIQIEDVDTTKIWRISEYDGAEGIEYYGKPEVIDKELNLGEW